MIQLLKYVTNMGYIMKTDKRYQYVPKVSENANDSAHTSV